MSPSQFAFVNIKKADGRRWSVASLPRYDHRAGYMGILPAIDSFLCIIFPSSLLEIPDYFLPTFILPPLSGSHPPPCPFFSNLYFPLINFFYQPPIMYLLLYWLFTILFNPDPQYWIGFKGNERIKRENTVKYVD